ncbi:MAG: hypothetical protein Q4D44_04015 [Eubacteriales bacterium]|nr:hypothetical protein [Eubacteriales bacterium]
MKKAANAFWVISALFLAAGALWGVFSGLSAVMSSDTVCGVSLMIFGVISLLAYFTLGVKSRGAGWLLFDSAISFSVGLAFVFSYVDAVLFNVSLVYILGLWLLLLGVSQIARTSMFSGAAKTMGTISGVLGALGGISLFVKPVSDFLLISEAMKLCGYSVTFMLIIAAVMVLCRLFSAGRKG